MVTFNHEKWIAQAIEGVVNQNTSFKYELVIGDDCSTDSTTKVIEAYIQKYPGIITLVNNPVNVGLAVNFSSLLNKCAGKYIAICEGDDFWTDPGKLEKQVNILESDPTLIICSHSHSNYHESDSRLEKTDKYKGSFTYDQAMFLRDWVTQPLTCVFRNFFRDYTLFNREQFFCDPIFFYELLKHGEGYYLNENMATFRVHMGALSSGLSRWQWFINHVKMYDHLFKYNKHDKRLQKISARYCLMLFVYQLQNNGKGKNDFKPLKGYYERTPSFSAKLFTTLVKIPYYMVRHGSPVGRFIKRT
jgi:glycosyltransferase involved in cell wall biosynthesis